VETDSVCNTMIETNAKNKKTLHILKRQRGTQDFYASRIRIVNNRDF